MTAHDLKMGNKLLSGLVLGPVSHLAADTPLQDCSKSCLVYQESMTLNVAKTHPVAELHELKLALVALLKMQHRSGPVIRSVPPSTVPFL